MFTIISAEWKIYLIPVVAEFAGTCLFLFWPFGCIQAAILYSPNASLDLLLIIALAFGGSLTINLVLFARVSGPHLNPLVTLGFMLLRKVPMGQGALFMIVQQAGAIAASCVVYLLLPGELAVGTVLAPFVSPVRGLAIRCLLITLLIIMILICSTRARPVRDHTISLITAAFIGVVFTLTQLFVVYTTGASLNPARSCGPALVTGKFPSYHWIYWAGPVLGALVAAGGTAIAEYVNSATE